jgi:hypothetical protein
MVIISLDSEPRTGKCYVSEVLVQKGRFKVGNSEISETLRKNVACDFDACVFEYCLAKILSVTPTAGKNVVYSGLHAKHTLVESMWTLGKIDQDEYDILKDCCDIFLNITPDVVVYSSSDHNVITTHCDKHDSKAAFFSMDVLRSMRRAYEKHLLTLPSVIRIDNQFDYRDGVIKDRILRAILPET